MNTKRKSNITPITIYIRLLTVAEHVVVWIKTDDVSGDCVQAARPNRAATDAGLAKAFPVISTVGPGRRLVVRALIPSSVVSTLLLDIWMVCGEHCRLGKVPWKFGSCDNEGAGLH
jgi:hypothetical protein